MRNLNLKRIGPIVLLIFIAMVSVSCAEQVKNQEEIVLSGKQLMNIHCISCHLLPKPESLDKTTWKLHVLPRMGYMMGFRNHPFISLLKRRILAWTIGKNCKTIYLI